jgi:hypothetical protein
MSAIRHDRTAGCVGNAPRHTDRPPMGEQLVNRAWWIGPVTCCESPGWGGTVVLAFLAAAGFAPPRGRGSSSAPAAAQRRGRTSLRPTSGDGSSGAGKGPFVLGFEGRVVVPVWLAEWSRKHPFGVPLAFWRTP